MSTSTAVAAGGGAAHTFAGAAAAARFTLALGDLPALCGDLTTVQGRKKALQLIDLYPEVMTSHNAGTQTEIYDAAMTYARDALHGDPTDAAVLRRELAKLIQQAPSTPGGAPADTPETDFTRDVVVLLPGTFCFTDDHELDAPSSMADKRREREDHFYAGNDAMGAFPITVHVEVQQGGAWQPAANTQVQVQLIDPEPGTTKDQKLDRRVAQLPTNVDGPPTSDRTQPGVQWIVHAAHASWNTAQDGARGYERRALDDHFQASDPGGVNVRHQRGGVRGEAVLNHVFKRAPGGPALQAGRPNAVKGRTDASGDLKLLFTPSRIAGDRFKIRVFVDPWNGAPNTGTQATDPRQESGVITVWKTIRLAGLVQKPVPANLARWHHGDSINGVTPSAMTLGTVDVARFAGVLRPACLLLRHDDTRQDFDQTRYHAALDYVRDHIRTYLHGKKYDMQALLPDQIPFVADDTQTVDFLPVGGPVTVTGHGAHDNQTISVQGLDASGTLQVERLTLNGTAAVTGATSFRGLVSVAVAAPAHHAHFRIAPAGGGGRSRDVHDRFDGDMGKLTLKSTSASDQMGVEVFGVDHYHPLNAAGVAQDHPVHEIVRLNGAHAVHTRYTYERITAVRVLNDDNGNPHAGTVTIALEHFEAWPALSMAPGTNEQNVTAVDVFDSPHTFTLRTPLEYNAARRKVIAGQHTSSMASGSDGWWDLSNAISACAKALAFHLAQNATGIVLHRAINGEPVSNLWKLARPYRVDVNHPDHVVPPFPSQWSDPTTSGLAEPMRAALVWYSNEEYSSGPDWFTYDLTANALHEFGHVLFLRHHWKTKDWPHITMTRQQGDSDDGGVPTDHDFHDVCVMSYHHCDGDYCGRCLLKLAGVKIHQIPANH